MQESSIISSQPLMESDISITDVPTTESVTFEVEDLRECSSLTLSLCSHLPYNTTAYPNLVGHISKEALLRDLVAFRELLDAECSLLAQVILFFFFVSFDFGKKYLMSFL